MPPLREYAIISGHIARNDASVDGYHIMNMAELHVRLRNVRLAKTAIASRNDTFCRENGEKLQHDLSPGEQTLGQ